LLLLFISGAVGVLSYYWRATSQETGEVDLGAVWIGAGGCHTKKLALTGIVGHRLD
jgi:hypothetical protein